MADQASPAPAGNGNGDAEVTVEQWLAMSDAERAQLPKARQKKLAKWAETLKKKEAKALALANSGAPPPGESNRAKRKAEKNKQAAVAAAEVQAEYVNTTPKGHFKDMSGSMMASYHPKAVESAWYDYWDASGYFGADASQGGKDENGQFVMVIPPPNVTGSLHIGHTLTNAIQDTLTRWHRMCGRTTVWLPGVDHAGIATQTVVEKMLWKQEKRTRHDLGREAFVERVWQWKNEYGDRIKHQTHRQGASVDWTREEFTMSPKLSTAVKEAFVRLYDDGMIYRDTRLTNWCTQLQSALSEIEVNYVSLEGRTMMKVPGYKEEIEFGVLTKFAYRMEGSDEEIVVATTRLETMLGDVAVAVHPEDPRYQHMIGKHLLHPFVDRKLAVIADSELVDMEFGTGAVKITPAHDPNDYSCGRRHQLPEINILEDNGCISANCGDFSGMKRYVARVEIEKALATRGLLRGKEPNPDMRLGLCSRTGDVIEPLLKPQWYVKCNEMAKMALDAAKTGELRIVPTSFNETWNYWMENIRDWCVSRQLWWGHRIPAYKVSGPGIAAEEWVVGRSVEEARERAALRLNVPAESIDLTQDDDVLDTWFSSGLFPFSTFGWPDTDCADYKAFYPNTLLETGHDIIFFWVARMVMMGLKLTGKLPFKTVFLHPMVRDKHGRKMTKSLGNVIDPLELYEGASLESLIEKLKKGNLDESEVEKASAGMRADYPDGIPECGSDAVRFALLAYTVQERDLNLDVSRVQSYRHFCNKLWNATKFVLAVLEADFKFSEENLNESLRSGSLADKWILDRLNNAVKVCNVSLANYKFGDLVTAAYNFWLYEFCDVYLEAVKPAMREDQSNAKLLAQNTLYHCLHVGLRFLHPMMPFITEELFQRLPNRRSHDNVESVMVSAYPQTAVSYCNGSAVRQLEYSQRIVRAIRSMRANYDLKNSARPNAIVVCRNESAHSDLVVGLGLVKTLAGLGQVDSKLSEAGVAPGPGCAVDLVDEHVQVHLDLAGLVDFEGELRKLNVAAARKRVTVEGLEKKIGVAGYEEKVPANIREKDQEMLSKARQELLDVEQLSERMKALLTTPQ